MGTDDGEVYILRPIKEEKKADESWVTPRPASDAILATVAREADTDPEEFDALSEYVDLEDLEALLDGETNEAITFDVENCAVEVQSSGRIDVKVED